MSKHSVAAIVILASRLLDHRVSSDSAARRRGAARRSADAAAAVPRGALEADPGRRRASRHAREHHESNVALKLYGASSAEIQLTGNDGDENNPTHVWTGMCTTPCGLALRDKRATWTSRGSRGSNGT